MDDIIEAIEEIYDAVGDVERWRRVTIRLAAGVLSAETAQHLEIARCAHEQQMRLMRDVATLAHVHNELAIGALVVDCDGLVLRANDVATRLLAEDNVRLVNGRIEAAYCDENALLHDAIGRASAGRTTHALHGPFVLVTRPGKRPLPIVVVRTHQPRPTFFENQLQVLLLLIDPDLSTTPGSSVLRELFGFTAREAEFSALLMEGRSVQEAAGALGVTVSTARTFLAHVTAKTDSHSQGELVGRLLAIPPVA
jgi:DNA-binding CsgD family transcriptional regulator